MKKLFVFVLAVVCLGCVGQISRVSADETQILETADIRLEISKTGYKYLNTDAGVYFELPYSPKRFDFCDRKLVEEGIQKKPDWLEKWPTSLILTIHNKSGITIFVYSGNANFSVSHGSSLKKHITLEQNLTNGFSITKEIFYFNVSGKLRTLFFIYPSDTEHILWEERFLFSGKDYNGERIVEIMDSILSSLQTLK